MSGAVLEAVSGVETAAVAVLAVLGAVMVFRAAVYGMRKVLFLMIKGRS